MILITREKTSILHVFLGVLVYTHIRPLIEPSELATFLSLNVVKEQAISHSSLKVRPIEVRFGTDHLSLSYRLKISTLSKIKSFLINFLVFRCSHSCEDFLHVA